MRPLCFERENTAFWKLFMTEATGICIAFRSFNRSLRVLTGCGIDVEQLVLVISRPSGCDRKIDEVLVAKDQKGTHYEFIGLKGGGREGTITL
jgi:hypothetical protein